MLRQKNGSYLHQALHACAEGIKVDESGHMRQATRSGINQKHLTCFRQNNVAFINRLSFSKGKDENGDVLHEEGYILEEGMRDVVKYHAHSLLQLSIGNGATEEMPSLLSLCRALSEISA